MKQIARLVGIITSTSMLAFAFAASAAEPPQVQPMVYSQTMQTESMQLVVFPNTQMLDLLLMLLNPYETDPTQESKGLAHTSHSPGEGLADLLIASDDSAIRPSGDGDTSVTGRSQDIGRDTPEPKPESAPVPDDDCEHKKHAPVAVSIPAPTPTQPKQQPQTTPKSAKAVTAPPVLTSDTIATLAEKPDGTKVHIEGSALVQPGVLAKQTFYLNDGTGGVQVYKHDADFPEIAQGQSVTIKGELSTSHGERRVKVSKNGSIEPSDSFKPLPITNKSIDQIQVSDHGSLIQTSGQVVSRSGNNIVIEQAGTQLTVSASDYTNIDPSVYPSGSSVDVTGIVVKQSGSIKLKPRATQDIVLKKNEDLAAASATGKEQRDNMLNQKAMMMAAGTGLVLSAFLVRRYHPKFNATYGNKTPLNSRTQELH